MTASPGMAPDARAHRHAACGMTLIELLVAMAIGVGLTAAVGSLVVVGENHKRTTTSTNDAEQTGAYAFYTLDRALRGAGSAIAESAYVSDHGVLGCLVNAAFNGARILPRPNATPFPSPFSTAFLTGAGVTSTAAVISNLRVAPLLIAPSASDATTPSDVLVVMNGSGSAGGVSRQVTGTGSSTSLVLDNTVGFFQYDLVLVSQSGLTDCLLEQVTTQPAVGTQTLAVTNTATSYYTAAGVTSPVTTLATLATSTASYVTPLGNAAINNLQFLLFGVGANRTLYSYDLLQNQHLVQSPATVDASQAIADGVDQMYALYGLDSNSANGVQDAWASPLDAGYDIGTVMTTPATMEKIISVRVALVMRGDYYDKNIVTPTTLTLFAGLTRGAGGTSLTKTVALVPNDQHYRYRVFEFTVPLRNMLLLDH